MAPKKSFRIPSLCRHKATGQGYVTLNGKRHYLGQFDQSQTEQRYNRLIAEWLSSGRKLPVPPDEITVVELCALYWRYAKGYYRKLDGRQTSEISNLRLALRPLKNLYGDMPAAEFGPRCLKTIRQTMIERRCSRKYINNSVARMKRIFKWAVVEELIPPSVYHSLQAVPGLKRGRSKARETEPVRPVRQAHIDAVRPYLSRQIWSLVQLQLLTAARSGELVIMRPIDINMAGQIWLYTPLDHKTAHHGYKRTIYVGPRAQRIIEPFLQNRPVDAYLFSPSEAEAERLRILHENRKAPLSCGNRPGTNRRQNPKWQAGQYYSRDSYRRAIRRACKAAGIPYWHPHQLRHNAATLLRAEFGLEAAQLILGHRRADVTQVYAEVNRTKALDIAAKVG